MQVAGLSDTHGARRWTSCPAAAWEAPPTQQFELDGLVVAMIHDSSPASRGTRQSAANARSIRARRPTGDVSHTARWGLLRIEGGLLSSARIVPVS